MASNPLYNTNDSPNNATQPAKAVNDSQVFVNRNRNTFDLSYFNYKTQRFGQYEPFFVMEGIPGDTIPLSSGTSSPLAGFENIISQVLGRIACIGTIK